MLTERKETAAPLRPASPNYRGNIPEGNIIPNINAKPGKEGEVALLNTYRECDSF
jgi:hypothetical protein